LPNKGVQGCLSEIGIFKIQTVCQTAATSQGKGERHMKTTARFHRKKKRREKEKTERRFLVQSTKSLVKERN